MIYRLCGGTLFTLLTQDAFKRPNTKKKLTILGEKSTVSENSMFVSLFRLLNPEHRPYNPDGLRSAASVFKNCKQASGSEFPLTDSKYTSAYHERVSGDYPSVLAETTEYCRYYLQVEDTEAMVSLVKAILELIARDEAISDNFPFHALADGGTITKAALVSSSKIHLPALLIGALDYIVVYAQDNTIGRKTIEGWQLKKADEHQIGKLRGDIGCSIHQSIEVSFALPVSSDLANMRLSDIDPEALARGHTILHSLLHKEALKEEFPGCRAYMEHISDKYNYIPTILQKEAFRPFRSYYIPNKVMMKVRDPKRPYTYWYETVPITDVSSLVNVSPYLVLSGSGGLGKSMMMRNILLTAIDEYDAEGRIPLFIPLKDYDKPYESFTDYIFEMVSNLWPDLTADGMETLLKSGKVLFLFDGLDEIHASLLAAFTKQMNGFIDRYYMNCFIISSRPYTNFQSFTRFSVLELQPFSKAQALEFVDRVNYHAEAPKLQARFRSLLNTTLYRTHNSFCGNPLLLSIMILTFELDADVPTVKHKFYQEAYIVLSRRHDALKDGYSRELKTGWRYDKFADYFAFFCTATYRDGKVSFDYIDMEKYFKLLAKKYKLTGVSVDDFIYDLTNNLCLMYMDGMQYSFIHRSFQEYFCAKFFNSQLDEQLTKVIPVFDQDNTTKKGDTALQMLYDMKPKAVALYMFLPYLNQLIESCERGEGIWSFLETIYPDYEMADGDCEADEDNCAPSSNLYAFILETYHLEIDVPFFDELEHYGYFVEETYVYREDIKQDDLDYHVPSDYEEMYGEPEITGHVYKLDWERINNNRGLYGDLARAIESPDSAFVKEYDAIKRLRADLSEKAKPSDESADFLDDME